MIPEIRNAFYYMDKDHKGFICSNDLLRNLELASSLIDHNNLLWNKKRISYS